MRRVVVTGMGIVSSIGNNTQEVLASLREGRSGVTPTELRQLRDWYVDASSARRVPLGRLHNLIQKIDRHITA